MEEDKYVKRQRFYKTVMLVILTVFLTFIFTTIQQKKFKTGFFRLQFQKMQKSTVAGTVFIRQKMELLK